MSQPKQFCKRGHDKFVVGVEGTQCRACRWITRHTPTQTVRKRARDRRYSLLKSAERTARAVAWNKAHPERHKQHQRNNYLKYRGVNFWVEAAKESV